MTTACALQKNSLLAALPEAVWERLAPNLKPVAMPLGKALYEPGDKIRDVYFPRDSIVSLLYVTEDGASAEISVVGNEGIVGVALFMGGRVHADPGGRAECRPRLKVIGAGAHGGVQPS